MNFSDNVVENTFKFQDFFQSININNINKYTTDILNNIIKVDYSYLKKIGTILISLIPFIDNERKKVLTNKYESFYNYI